MSHSGPAPTAARRRRLAILAALAFVSATLIGAIDGQVVGQADGAVPAGLTVFDDDVPAVANLDPDLLDALRHAATDAAGDGVTIVVNSGWRSPAYQRHLLHEAVSRYGSKRKATRWVAAADRSFHVSGDAVDIGPSNATAWLFKHGAQYGLCRIYRNEPWHYELRPEAIDDGCPSMYADPAHDPRMQL
jgi:D-alanyl-D-alanine carboxypeptidase